MFCTNCGTKIEEEAEFCQKYGTKVENSDKTEKGNKRPADKKLSTVLDDAVFYGEDWIRAKYFAISSLPHFDILVTKDNFYLIRLPKTHGATLGLILGLVLFNILGAIVGTIIGNSSDKNKRKKYRLAWVDSDLKLTSREYENNVFLKIQKDKLRNTLSFRKDKFVVIADDDETITLKKNKNEYERFSKFIESYVL